MFEKLLKLYEMLSLKLHAHANAIFSKAHLGAHGAYLSTAAFDGLHHYHAVSAAILLIFVILGVYFHE
jgi:hypothetical protein